MRVRHRVARRASYWILLALLPFLSHGLSAQAPPTETLTFASIADTYVDSTAATTNFNSDARLRVRSPDRIAYLRFAVTGVNGRHVQQARLKLGTVTAANNGGTIHRITNNNWNEATVTYNTRPAIDGPGLHTQGAVTIGQLVEFNLDTTVTADGVYNLAIDSSSTDGISYNSAMATSGQKPELVLVVDAARPTVTIAQPADGASFFVGDSITLQGTAASAAGADISASIAWTSSLQGSLGTGATLMTLLTQGSHTVTATVTDGGISASAQIDLTVTARPAGNTEPLVTITAPASGQVVTPGTAVTFTGTASDLEDGNLTAGLAWTSDRDGALGTGGSFSRTLSNGTHHITAAVTDHGGLAGQATVTVQVQPLVTMDFTPIADAYVDAGLPTTNFGTSAFLRVDANTQRLTYLRFVVSGVGTRNVTQAVLRMQVDATAGAESDLGGSVHKITNNTWAENTVTFNTRPALDGPVIVTAGAVARGQTVDFNLGTAVTADGTYNFAIDSSSSNAADYRSREGGPAPKLILTVSGSPPAVNIVAPADGAVAFQGELLTCTGQATDLEDGDLGDDLRWTSSRDGAIGTGATFGTTTLSIGTHTITAAVTDADGLQGEAQRTVRVRGPNVAPTISITAPADGASAPAGTTVTLEASAADDFDTNLSSQIQWTSSRDGALGTGASLAKVLSEGSHTVTASVTDSDGASASAQIAVTILPTSPSVTITAPAEGTRVLGGTTLTFSGSATDATDGNLSGSLRWTSDHDGPIGTGASFTTASLSVGTHLIIAAATDMGGLTGLAQRTVVVRPPNAGPAVTIETPADGTVLLTGKPILLAATATDPEDGDVAASVRWTSSQDGVLGTGATLVVPSLSVGTHTLTASATDRDGASASASIGVTVSPATLTFLPVADTYVDSGSASSIFGSATGLYAGTSPTRQTFLRFTVSGKGSFTVQQALLRLTVGSASGDSSPVGGTLHTLTNDTWSEASTNYTNRPTIDGPVITSRATVAANQVVDFDLAGVITADGSYNFALVSTSNNWVRYLSRESSTGKPQLILTLTQNSAPLVRITAPAAGSRLRLGAPVTFTGTATDAENGNLSGQIAWRSNRDGNLGTGASLTVSTLTAGPHTITAQVTDAGGRTAQAQLTLEVTHAPVVSITTPANGAIVFTDDFPITLAGQVTDVEDGDLSSQLQWSSDRDGPLATGASISVNTLSVGLHTLIASVTDEDGIPGQAQITLRVRAPNVAPTVTISAPASGASTPAGTSMTLTASASDDFDTGLSNQLRWTSSRDGALGTGPSQNIVLTEGSHTLTAAVTDSDGAEGSAQVQVTITPTAPVVTITAPVEGARMFVGTPFTFSGSATDATDGPLSASLRWLSNRDGLIGTGPSFVSSVLTVGTHIVSATVSDAGGLVGEAHRTVVVRPPNVPPVIAIEAPTNGDSLLAGKPVLLAATATDAEDGDLGTLIRWTSSRDGLLGTGTALVVPSLTAGSHVLTAAITDRDGAPVSASVGVTVVPSTITVTATADTYVDSGSPSASFGTATVLQTDGSPINQTFLRFPVSGIGGLRVQQALLRLTVSSSSGDASNSGGTVHRITNTSWSETTTYNTRPTVDGPPLATRAAVTVNQVVDFDVTSAVTADDTYNFALVSTSSDGAKYRSREASSAKPQLIVTLTQNTAPVVHIMAPPSGTRVLPATPVTFSGSATDAEGGNLSSQIQWRSDRDGVLGTGATLTVTSLRSGNHTITAQATDAGGLFDQEHITLSVTHPPSVAISAPAHGAIFFVEELPITLAGHATDVEDGDLGNQLGWTSSRDGSLDTGASISASTLSVGTHTITAATTDDDGLHGEAQITIRVRRPNVAPTVAIMAPPSGAAAPAGSFVTLAATATDDFDGDLSSQIRWTSSRDGALGTGASRSLILTEGTHTLTAAVTDSDGAPASADIQVTITPTPPTVAIATPPTGTRVFEGTALGFSGSASDATDGTLSSALRWTSSLDGLIGTGPSFTIARLSIGTHTITAAATDGGGLTGQAQRNVTIRPPNVPPVVTIVSPTDGDSLLTGKPIVLGAEATDTEDGDLGATVRWTSSRDGALGTGATILRSSLSIGTHTLTAQVTDLDGASVSATATVTVVAATITLTPTADTYVDSGATTTKFGTATSFQAGSSPVRQTFLRFAVTGIGDFHVEQALLRLKVGSSSNDASAVGGTVHTITNNTWSEASTTYNTRPAVDGPAIASFATVTTNQVVDFNVTTGITADATANLALVSTSSDWVKYASREASTGKPQLIVTLKQDTAPVVNITAPAANAIVNVNAPVTFSGTATDAESGNLSAQLQWSSNLDGPLGTGATVSVPALTPGVHIITARLTDPSGLTGEAEITLNVGHRPQVAITSPLSQSVFFTSDFPISLSGTASDQEDGNIGNHLRWTSSRDGAIGGGPTVNLAALTIGTHTITASATDSHNLTGQAQITIRVRGPNVAPTIVITAPADGASTPAGTPVTLTATATDDFDGDLTSQIRWTSSRDGALGMGGTRTLVLTEGGHTITAAVTDSDDVSSSVQLHFTVTPTPPVVTITEPTGPMAFLDASVTFSGTALDATDGELSASLVWTSDRDGLLGTGASFAISTLSSGPHTITAAVTDAGGLAGQAQHTLTVIRVPNVAILLPEPNGRYLTSTPVTFFGTAEDRLDGDVSPSLTWTSDRDGVIGTGSTFVASTLSEGQHTVVARATNSEGNTNSAQVTFIVRGETLTFEPIADTYVDEGTPTTKYGTGLELVTGIGGVRQAFLRFAVSGIDPFPVAHARLELTVGSSSTASGGFAGTVQTLTSNTWSEALTTYNNRPTIDGPVLDTVESPVVQGQTVEFDVGSAFTGDGTYNFALTSPSSDAGKYESREATAKPRLVVFLGQPETRRLPEVTVTQPVSGSTVYDDAPVTFMAHAMDSERTDLSASITWRSSLDGPLGTGGSVTVPRLSRGTHAISASAGDARGLVGTHVLTLIVVDRPPTVTITGPEDGHLFPLGFPVTFTATATDDQDGDLAPALTWTSHRDGTIGTGRTVTIATLSPGDHVVTAAVTNALGTTGSQTITVFAGSAPPRITITAPASGLSVAEGTPLTLTGSATDVEDGDLSALIAWTSSLQGVLGTGPSVPVALTMPGTHRITARVTDSHDFTRTAEITVTITAAPPTVRIASPADGSSFSGAVTLVGTATDFRDGDLSGSIRWRSSVDGTLGTGAALTTSRLSLGRHVITAEATDRNALVGSASITIAAGDAAPVVAILEPTSGTTRPIAQPLTFRGTAVDGIDGNLGTSIRWLSNLNGLLGTGASINTTALARGTHVITAEARDSKGQTGSAQVMVAITASVGNQPPNVTITTPASGASFPAGTPVSFAGTAVDDMSGNVSSGLTWHSDRDGLIGTGGSFTVSELSPGTHHVIAAVPDASGLVGSAGLDLTVTAPASTFAATADAYTDELAPSTNFGTASVLLVDNQPVRRIYLRFVVSGLDTSPIERVVVRMHTTSATAAGSDQGGEIRRVSGPWDELTVNHTNKPVQDGALLSSVGVVNLSQPVEWDVTAAVTGNGTYNFGLKTLSTNGAEYVAQPGSGGPALIVFQQAPVQVRPIVTITAPADLASLPSGSPTTFSATANDPQEGDVSASLVWQSDRDGALGTGSAISATLSPGTHLITAQATDSGGNVATDVIYVTVGTSSAPQVSIVAPASGTSVQFGLPVALLGTAFDSSDGDLSFSLHWSSSLDGDLGTGPSLLRTLSPGTHTLTASVTDRDANPASATTTLQVTATPVGYEDFVYGPNIDVDLNKATASKPESKLWYTDDGIWWATLFVQARSEYHIHRFDFRSQSWIDTGIFVDERGKSRQDALWESATQKLYMVSRFSGTPPQNRLLRYTYYAAAQRFVLDPGFPVNIAGGGTEAFSLDKDSTGTLWVAYTLSDKVWVNRTLGSDTEWGTPFVIPVPEGTTAWYDDIAGIIALPGQIGVFWSNQVTDKFYFAVHTDGLPATDPAAWRLEIAAAGGSIADDHFNMKLASDGRLFVGHKTNKNSPTNTLIGLLVRSPQGIWSADHKVTNQEFLPTRVRILLDEVSRRVYVFYSTNQSYIYYKSSDMDSIAFPTGIGTPFMLSGTTPDVTTTGGINNPTSTKQNTSPGTGFVVLAATGETTRYWHNGLAPVGRPVVTISAPASGLKVRTGSSVTFSGTAVSPTDGILTAGLKWISNVDGLIGTGGSITTSSLSNGIHTITASATDGSKLAGTATVTVTVETDVGPAVTILQPTTGQKLLAGQPIAFNGAAIDSLDGNRSASLVWTSNRDGQIGTGTSFTRNNLSLGTHAITARATDNGGLAGSAVVALEIQNAAPPVVSISSPTRTVFEFGTSVPFVATATDTLDGNLTPRLAWSSSRDGAIGTGGSFIRSTLSRGAHTITARVTDSSGLTASASLDLTIEEGAPPVVTITTPANGVALADHRPVTFTATAVDFFDGDVSWKLAWTSNRDGAMGTGTSITTDTLSVGQHTITASAVDGAGLTGIAQIGIEIREQPAPAVMITAPADGSIALFTEEVTFTGTATDTIEGDISARLEWRSDRDGVIATGATVRTSSLSIGRHTITASATNSGDRTGSAQMLLSVESGPQIVILGPTDMAVVPHGELVTFSGVAFDFEDGDLTPSLAWTSSRDGALGNGGSVTVTLTRGVHTITTQATDRDGHTAMKQIAVDVVARPTVILAGPANGSVFRVAEPVTLTGFATDPVDGSLTSSLTWTSSLDGALGTGGELTVTTLRSGTHTITAQATNSRGLSSQQQLTLIVNDPPDVTITAPADSQRVAQGVAITFTATGTDREDGNLEAAILWTSSRDGVLGVGPSLTVATLSPGVHTITASLTDAGGRSDTDTRTLTILGKPVVTLTSPLDGAIFTLGEAVSLSATATDFENGDLTGSLIWTSTRDGALGMGGSLSTSTLSPGIHTIVAQVIDQDGLSSQKQTTITVNAPASLSLTEPADGTNVESGVPVVFQATASDLEDGNLTSAILWMSNLDGAFGTGGSVTTSALRSGLHTITASVTDSAGKRVSRQITLVVNGSPIVTITAPAHASVFPTATAITFAATANDTEDGNIASAIVWSSNLDGALGTGGSITTSALRYGTHTITASATDSDGKTGSAEITVVISTAPTVVIDTPATASVFVPGEAITFTGHATDTEDGDLASQIVWSSNLDGSFGTGGSITLSTLRYGTHTITAAVTDRDGRNATAQITLVINTAPTVTINAPTGGSRFEPGDAITFTATATDPEDGTLTSAISWASSLDGPLGSGGSITTSALSSGTHTITASVTDVGGRPGSAEITVVVNSTPTVAISAPTLPAVFSPGDAVTFTGTATDVEEGTLTSAIVWSSSLDGPLGTGGSITTSALSSGTHVITAAATDAGSTTGSAQITIVVNAPPVVTITAPVDGSSFEHAAAITFTATATDTEDSDLASSVAWTSNLDGDLGTGGTIVLDSLRSGTHTITAAVTDAGGKSGSTAIMVVINSTPVVAISAPTDGSIVSPGHAVTFAATATDVEDEDLTSAITWNSNLDGDLAPGGSITTSALSSGTHVITAAATDSGGKTGSQQITIVVNAAPTVAIVTPTDNSPFEPEDAITFTGTASDSEDGTLSGAIIWTSGATTLGTGASVTHTFAAGTHTVTATVTDAGGKSDAKTVTVIVNDTPTVAIETPANNSPFEPEDVIIFMGTASDSEDGPLSSAIVWTSGATTLGTGASVTHTFAAGTHTVTATVTDAGGKSDAKTVTVIVNDTPTVAIETPANNSPFEPEDVITFTGTASDSEDGPLSSAIVWTSGATTLGTGASVTHTFAAGTHTVTATVTDAGGKSATDTVTVIVNDTPTVAIDSPADNSPFEPEDVITFTGTALDGEDGPLSGTIVWTSGATTLGTGASVTHTFAAGTHVVTATVTDAGGKSATDTVTVIVNDMPTVDIATPADNSAYEPEDAITFTASATDTEDEDLSDTIVWTSGATTLGTGASVTHTFASGTHTVTATVTDAGGKSDSTSVTVVVNDTPTVAITAPAGGSTFASGEPVTFTGTASDTEDGSLTSAISWSSDLDGPLGTGGGGETSTLSAGTHTITASVTDAGGKNATQQITITVNP